MKIKKALQGCSGRAKSRSRSPFSNSSGLQSVKEITEILDTNLKNETWDDPWPPRSGDKAKKAGDDSKSKSKSSEEAYDMRSNSLLAPKQVTWKDPTIVKTKPDIKPIIKPIIKAPTEQETVQETKQETKQEKKPGEELCHVNKLFQDVHRVEERVKELEGFLNEVNKAKTNQRQPRPVHSSSKKDYSCDEYWKVKNENISMTETMRVLAKLVQRQEQSLQRHRHQAMAHQTELQKRREFIHELERELDGKQKSLQEVRRKDVEYQKRVRSVNRNVQELTDATIEMNEHELGVQRILQGIHPSSYDELPSIPHLYDTSSSSESASEQYQSAYRGSDKNSMRHLDHTIEGIRGLKARLEEEQFYLLKQRELMKLPGSNDTEYSNATGDNLLIFESSSTCSASDVTFNG